jgi:hypothetical protein
MMTPSIAEHVFDLDLSALLVVCAVADGDVRVGGLTDTLLDITEIPELSTQEVPST